MIKSRPLLELTPKEFIKTLWTWTSLQYRNKWLKKEIERLWLNIIFRKYNWKLVVSIHKKYLVWRRLHNPYFKDEEFALDWPNCLVNKHLYNEERDRGKNLEKISRKGFVLYYANKWIKWFIFYLIKLYYNDRKERI